MRGSTQVLVLAPFTRTDLGILGISRGYEKEIRGCSLKTSCVKQASLSKFTVRLVIELSFLKFSFKI